ncbi:hypothetical protein CTEN210_02770 [Chaetoceros tenuissimus]|uniref:Leucine-rich repeat domain-containing protein n=1 Tax=Chaetoceros tenuissimus TaxID=426638 RepID=A0AAD3CK17_9STRA|nr:hypothetical protein CTEN210_02770 [Chaetoceros tenuissimus]
MRVATVDGLVTLFYDGSKELYNRGLHEEWEDEYDSSQYLNVAVEESWEEWPLSDECKRYWRERQSWQQIIVVEGVTVIPAYTFRRCKNIKRVIFSNTVVRIETWAFIDCISLTYIKLSINIEKIGNASFYGCDLIRVFIPPRCRQIGSGAFKDNKNLEICHVPQETRLGESVIAGTKLIEQCQYTPLVNKWLKNINRDEKYSLHRACSSFQPLKTDILTIIQDKGIGDFKTKNEIDITPSQYLKENPYCDLKVMDIIRDYMMKMMGENE